MEQQVLQLLESEYPDIDFRSGAALVDDGILDSLTITGIVAALSLTFDVTIPYEEITEENFNSVTAMAAMIERL